MLKKTFKSKKKIILELLFVKEEISSIFKEKKAIKEDELIE